MSDFDWFIQLRDEGIEVLNLSIPGFIKEGDLKSAALLYPTLVMDQVERALMRWRQGKPDRTDLTKAYEVYLQARAFIYGLYPNYDAPPHWDLFARAFSLIDGIVEVPPLVDRNRRSRYMLSTRYLSWLIQDREPDRVVESQVMALLETKRALFDRSYTIYFKLLGALPTTESTDSLIRQAEVNWEKRRTDRFFESALIWEGHGDYNVVFPDVTLAAILKKIGWTGDSIHRYPF